MDRMRTVSYMASRSKTSAMVKFVRLVSTVHARIIALGFCSDWREGLLGVGWQHLGSDV